jgi:hypothetical protein
MGGIEDRLRALEEVYAWSPGLTGDGGGGGFTRELGSGVLAACAHVRCALIDLPPHGYEIQKLRAREPWTLAQYVAALTILRHEDEDEARELLAEEAKPGDEPVLWSLIDAVVDRLRFSQGREAGF